MTDIRKVRVGTPLDTFGKPENSALCGPSTSYTAQGRHGHPEFYKLLDAMADLHDRKNHDYAADADPLSNLKLCEGLGIPAWKGVLVRLTDKWSRITQLSTKAPLVTDESMEDTLIDNAVYSLLAIVLRREEMRRHHGE